MTREATHPIDSTPVPGIEPVDGWELRHYDEWDGEGFKTAGYLAQRGDDQRSLRVSRFRFTPSQARFAWLVRSGFPVRQGAILGPWDDTEIEARIAAEAVPA